MNRNKKAIRVKTVAISLAVAMTAFSNSAVALASPENTLSSMIEASMKDSQSDAVDKEESVYVIADAKGEATKVIVSNHLNNKDNKKTISDVSDLDDIVNIKGDEEFVEGSGNLITWQADGSDIYYQGTTNEELPVDLNVTYKLDGKEISPKDLAGKDGKVTIRFDYENKVKKEVTVKGKTYNVYVPFTAISGLILPANHFSNISITNGKLISQGDNNIAVGFAFPGLEESISSGKNDITKELDIPDYIEITADAKDFALDMSMTMLTPNLLNDMNVDNIKYIDDLKKSLDDLNDATDKLIDGTKELKDGVSTLEDKSQVFATGIKSLTFGILQAKDGIGALESGAGTLNQGAVALNAGIKQYTEGLAAANTGAGQLLTQGFEGEEGAVAGSQSLATGAATVDAGVTELVTGLNDMYTQIENKITENSEQIARIRALPSPTADQINQLNQLAGANAALNQIKSSIDSQDMLTKVGTLKVGTGKLAAGANGLATGINTIYEKTGQIKAGLDTLNGKSDSLVNGSDALVAGAAKLSEGTKTLNQSSLKLVDGGNTLSDGSTQLIDGIGKLANGAKELNDGMNKYNEEGISKLTNAVNVDITDIVDSLKAVVKAGEEYDSFTGISKDMTGSLKFVIKTESIK